MLCPTHLEFRDGKPTGKVSVDTDALLALLRCSYSILNGHEFPGRGTIDAQAFLAYFRDCISEVSGDNGQTVQDAAANGPAWFEHAKDQPNERKRFASESLYNACTRVEALIDSDLRVGMAHQNSKEQALRQVREAIALADKGPRVV